MSRSVVVVRSVDIVEGQGWVEVVRPVEIDPLSVTFISADSFVSPSEGLISHDLKISFDNGTSPIVTKDNGAEVLRLLSSVSDDNLAHKFVQVTHHDRFADESGCSIGWVPRNDGAPEIISVPDFLEKYLS